MESERSNEDGKPIRDLVRRLVNPNLGSTEDRAYKDRFRMKTACVWGILGVEGSVFVDEVVRCRKQCRDRNGPEGFA